MTIHGKWDSVLIRNVLVTQFAEDFNLEGAEARFADLRRLAPAGTIWVSLNESHSWGASDPEVLASLKQQRQWMFANGCVCIATVVPDHFHILILQNNAGSFSADLIRYFLTMDEAIDWLGERGFAIDLDEIPPPRW